MSWFEETWNTFVTFMRSIDMTVRLVVVGVLAIILCMCVISFIKKGINKGKIKWIYALLGVFSLGVIVLLLVFI